MNKPSTGVMLKALIIDSLMARSGKQLTSEVIKEISDELPGRMVEVIQDEKEAAIDEIIY